LIVIVALPEFVNVMVSGLEEPTTTLLKLKLPGVAPRVLPSATALPVIDSVCGEPGMLSVNVTLPLAPLVDVGENCTLNDMFCPAAIVFGSESPVIPKPVPVSVARFSTRFEFPVFPRVTVCVLMVPTGTLLKLRDEGLTESTGSVPVPLNEIASGELDALLVTVSVPVAAAAAVGANWICTVMLCPTGIEEAGFPPITVNAAPEIVAALMFTVAVPVFVTLTLCVPLLPTATLPKLTLVEPADNTPAGGSPVLPPPPPVPLPAVV
jgi:hypothetical protein